MVHRRTFGHRWLLAGCLLAAGCASTGQQQELGQEIDALQASLDAVRAELGDTRQALVARDAAADTVRSDVAQRLSTIDSRLDLLPATLADLCPPAQATSAPRCEPRVEVRTVTVSSDKLVVGEVERIMLDPPGAVLIARIDTGADSSSVHADAMVEFERDGNRWVRFDIPLETGTATVERPIKRFVRVIQESDPDGSRRPVVELRVRLGNVRETVEFTLADRSHMANEILLGRNFLTDVAVVDVGQQFVQPPPKAPAQGR